MAGSRRRASRKPSTATTVAWSSSSRKRHPVCTGLASFWATAKRVWSTIDRSLFWGRDTASPSPTVGSSGNSIPDIPSMVNSDTPPLISTRNRWSQLIWISSLAVLRTISENSLEGITTWPSSSTRAGRVEVMPNSRLYPTRVSVPVPAVTRMPSRAGRVDLGETARETLAMA